MNDIEKAILIYLGTNDMSVFNGIQMTLCSGVITIDIWNLDSSQPTIAQLQKIYDDNEVGLNRVAELNQTIFSSKTTLSKILEEGTYDILGENLAILVYNAKQEIKTIEANYIK